MQQHYSPRYDTRAWIFQVWASFVISVFLCAVGVWNLPGQGLERAFLAVGFFFCLFTSFTLAKTIRDNRDEQVDTQPWIMQVWLGFVIAITLCAWGLAEMNIEPWRKGYVAVSALFMVSSAFTLAKTIRDNHESALLALPRPAAEG